jgi:hypothetical protein
MNAITATKTRPGWVWFIFIWYTVNFVVNVLLFALFLSKSLPMTPQYKAGLTHVTTFDYVHAIMQLLLLGSAALVLFLLRKQATYLFWLFLGFNLVSAVYYDVLNNGLRPHIFGGKVTTALVAIGSNVAICIYCEALKRNGTLT